MKLIPANINESSPYGEKRIFQILKSEYKNSMSNWLVYHSLNYPVEIEKKNKTSYLYFGETDFLVFIPNKGLINIEIKGGKISSLNGEWFTENRQGVSRLKKSPFVQAKDSLKNIEKFLETKGIRIPQAFLVVFPDCDFDLDSIEWSIDNLCSGSIDTTLIGKLNLLEKKYLTEGARKFFPNEENFKKLKSLFRINFESFISNHTLLKQSESEINRFTEEQIQILDQIDNKRLLITGCQGTGKTALAHEIINRKIIENKKILFINSNRLINEETKKIFSKINSVDCKTFSNFLTTTLKNFSNKSDLESSALDSFKSENFNEKNNQLVTNVLNLILESTKKFDLYDCIVLDEVQNYYHYNDFYSLIDCVIAGGLKKGSWYLLGDFEFQQFFTLSDTLNLDNKHPKKALKDYDFETQRLTDNVRNATDISIQSPILSNVCDKMPYRPGVKEGKVRHFFKKGKKLQAKKLEDIIKQFYEDGIEGTDIVILSPYRLENEENVLNYCDISKYYKIINLTKINSFGDNVLKNKDHASVFFSTIQYFQGMESKIVILTDPLKNPFVGNDVNISQKNNLQPENLLTFSGMGRANSLLYVIWESNLESYVSIKKAQSLNFVK